jgi:hypothetical protein
MGYIARPVRQRVDFHPWLRPLASTTTHKLLTRLFLSNKGNPLIAKAEGMLRFYLEGKRSLKEQDWPENLVSCKTELLNSLVG